MASDDKTVFDPGATIPENDKTEIHVSDLTVADPGKTVSENGNTRLASDETVPEGGEPAQSRSVSVYEKGSMILETYRFEDGAIEAGSMARFWSDHHTGWNTELAMKQQRGEFSPQKSKRLILPASVKHG